MRRRILFLRHFHRMWPRFFHTRELRFIQFASETGAGSFPRLLGLPPPLAEPAAPRAPKCPLLLPHREVPSGGVGRPRARQGGVGAFTRVMYTALVSEPMETSDLEIHLVEFRQKSFQFHRLVDFEGVEFVVFSRTETESERQFRPKLVHLHLVIPRSWLTFDEDGETLRFDAQGASRPAPPTTAAEEVGSERPEFTEGGIRWKRLTGPGGFHLYVPEPWAEKLDTPEGHRALGLLPPS
jgi:hypothetical protein